jgi:hypothetical protein
MTTLDMAKERNVYALYWQARVSAITHSDLRAREWSTLFVVVSTRDADLAYRSGHVAPGLIQLSPITTSGFEQKYIFTSQIASG